MGVLRIHLFGSVHITRDGWHLETNLSRAIMALFAYLILYRNRPHSREVLAGIFWGDHTENRARSCLSTALWRLRKALEPGGIPRGTYLETTSIGEIGFNCESNHWLDIAVFEDQTKHFLSKPFQSLHPEDACEFEDVLGLYAGDLLEGFYDDWALRERERLRSLYLHSLAHLLQYYRHCKAYEMGLACGHKILNLDPLREEIHREMMRLYYANGQRALALRQYDLCCKILETELDVSPMEETQLLHVQIFKRADCDRVQTRLQGDLRGAQQAIREFQRALRNFDKSTEQLRLTSKILEQIFNCQDLT